MDMKREKGEVLHDLKISPAISKSVYGNFQKSIVKTITQKISLRLLEVENSKQIDFINKL
jgi:hypothetical protein